MLRVFRLLKALPNLQLIIGALLKSIPSMAYVGILLGLLFYVYAVAGVFLFGKNDPLRFGHLGVALLSLFQTVTLEGWTDLMFTQMHGCARAGYGDHPELCLQPAARPIAALAYFISFVLIGTMIILNLFIGVIMNGMEEAQSEREQEARAASAGMEDSTAPELIALRAELHGIQQSLARVARIAGALKPDALSGEPSPAAKSRQRLRSRKRQKRS